ncbi:MAG: chlorite dismutase family protein [Candidatus Thermoplasmatota archaeon]|nr:chlorite dismutase family protein [Candidatus Thermoplasmatota archaeon]
MPGAVFIAVITASLTDEFHLMDQADRAGLLDLVDEKLSIHGGRFIHLKRYSTLRADSDFMIWFSSREPETVHMVKTMFSVEFGKYFRMRNLFLSMYEHSPYVKKGTSLEDTLRVKAMKFFIAYPMSKSSGWYMLPFEERKKILADHIGMAVSHPENSDIISYTTYSYGLGDHEFVVMYETDSLESWSHVTAKLREAEARKWIVNETPLIVGRYIENLSSIILG